jgi:hypothetical protein
LSLEVLRREVHPFRPNDFGKQLHRLITARNYPCASPSNAGDEVGNGDPSHRKLWGTRLAAFLGRLLPVSVLLGKNIAHVQESSLPLAYRCTLELRTRACFKAGIGI